uniref:ZFPL1-like B-box zinc-binding domain-containing protein n=1 Tax=Nelumbo nucifera TaxID=4432 RepID=A0A822XV66_NELNU|nr:TPA_asm: hypothetical protein HUJ06_022801 [Nelumbo nucifera]
MFWIQATKLYCFVHKVPVCGECICFPEHQICVVTIYTPFTPCYFSVYVLILCVILRFCNMWKHLAVLYMFPIGNCSFTNLFIFFYKNASFQQ